MRRITPTAEIYFTWPLRRLISRWPWPVRGRPIARIGPNAYHCNGRAAILRYATRAELAALRALKPVACAWLIDDDLHAVDADEGLPPEYRRRLRRFRRERVPRILAIASEIMAPSARILRGYGHKPSRIVSPAWIHLCRDLGHFDRENVLRMVFTGTRSHMADLAFIAPVLRRLCDEHRHLRVTTFLGRYAPASLQGHPRIENRPPLSWPAYRASLVRERFHVAIAPNRPGPFNLARSANKILEHAAFGAVGVYADVPPFSDLVPSMRAGVLVDGGRERWHGALSELMMWERGRLKRLARGGVALAGEIGAPSRLRRMWLEFFGLR